jgi:hypothetical protein
MAHHEVVYNYVEDVDPNLVSPRGSPRARSLAQERWKPARHEGEEGSAAAEEGWRAGGLERA